MKAIASTSGGVIFIPDEGENENGSISYRDLLKEEQGEKAPVFGKRSSGAPQQNNAKNVA
jgi:hypothetical protein